MDTLERNATYWENLISCRLCRNVALAAFLSLLIVEALILIPSYGRFERDLLVRYQMLADQFARGLQAYGDMSAEEWSRLGTLTKEGSLVRGGALYDTEGVQLAIFGERPYLAYTPDDTQAPLMDYDPANRDRYDIIVANEERNTLSVLRLDVSKIHGQLLSFAWRVLGLGLLISLCVTGVIMMYLNRYVLSPILRLSWSFVEAGANLGDSEKYKITDQRRDELGDVFRSFNAMLERIGKDVRHLDSRVEHLATHDPITSLPNAMLFEDRLNVALTEAQHSRSSFALLRFELSDFEEQTKSLEISGRDSLLCSFSERLQESAQDNTVSRLRDLQFALLFTGENVEMRTAQVANAILAVMRTPMRLKNSTYKFLGSIGIALYPTDGENAPKITESAELALARAKSEGGDRVCFFVADIDARMQEMLRLERDLRSALARDEIIVYYQPKVAMDSGEITGVEALVRWQHPERGLVSPMDFIPIAERTGLIHPIGMYVLEEACRQTQLWRHDGRNIHVAVNLSAEQFKADGLVEEVQTILKRTGLSPTALELEITETTVMTDMEFALAILRELSALCIMLVVDDFGTGYSSLAYLKQLPVCKMKIDRSFVIDLETDSESEAIAGAIIDLAHNLRLNVVAEGIENDAQWQHLKDRGCDEGQGYLFGRPMQPEDLTNRFILPKISIV